MRVVPASPLAGIALSRATSLDEIIKVAIKLRHSFRRYRALLAEYRSVQNEALISQTYAAAKQAEDIEKSFEQALQIGMREVDTDLQMTHKFVFDQLGAS